MRIWQTPPLVRVLGAVAILVGLLSASAPAAARSITLRWKMPPGSPDPPQVNRFEIHTGPNPGAYDAVIDAGLPARDSRGVYEYDLSVADGSTRYIAVRAFAGALTSELSNEEVIAPEVNPTFSDVTVASGIDYLQYRVTTPPVDSDAEYMTGGAAAGDFDGDGWTDLYVTRLDARDLLFRNNADGTFTDVAVQVGLGANIPSNGAVWGDIDNDGDLDLYVTTLGPTATRFYLFVNNGAGGFNERAVFRGAAVEGADAHYGGSVSLGDYDLDGFLDIHTTEWRPDALNPQGALSNARLLRNRGSSEPGFFDDVTQAAGVALDGIPPQTSGVSGSFSLSSGFADLDADGWPELLVAGDFGTSRLFWNNGDGTFTDGTAAAGVGTAENATGLSVGDYDNDGFADIFVSSVFDPSDPCAQTGAPCNWGSSGNRLYRYAGNRTFSDETDASGIRDAFWGSGALFLDFENDRDLDLFVTNGVHLPYLSSPGDDALLALLARFTADPTRVWENHPNGNMTEVSQAVGAVDDGPGRGALTFDYDRDGDLDVFVVNNAGHPVLMRNDGGNQNSWLRVAPVGTDSNKEGLGAVVSVWTVDAADPLVRQVNSAHFLGQSERIAHFGLGAGTATIDRVWVYWPKSGHINEFTNVARNQVLIATEHDLGPTTATTDSANSNACGLIGIEPLLVLAVLRRRRRRSAPSLGSLNTARRT